VRMGGYSTGGRCGALLLGWSGVPRDRSQPRLAPIELVHLLLLLIELVHLLLLLIELVHLLLLRRGAAEAGGGKAGEGSAGAEVGGERRSGP